MIIEDETVEPSTVCREKIPGWLLTLLVMDLYHKGLSMPKSGDVRVIMPQYIKMQGYDDQGMKKVGFRFLAVHAQEDIEGYDTLLSL